jgi:hypothetical protein
MLCPSNDGFDDADRVLYVTTFQTPSTLTKKKKNNIARRDENATRIFTDTPPIGALHL